MLQNPSNTAGDIVADASTEISRPIRAREKNEEEKRAEWITSLRSREEGRREVHELSVLAHRLAGQVESGFACASVIDLERVRLATLHVKAAAAFAENAFRGGQK